MNDRRARAVLYAVFAAGTLLRFVLLTKQSFWYDEAVSADLARHDLWQVAIGHVRDLGNPPFHSVLLGLWSRVFGTSDGALRAMSALIGSLTIPAFYAIGRRIVGDRAALIATVLFAFSPLQIYYSQEARTYSVLLLVTLTGAYALFRGIEAPTEKRWWVLYAVMTFAGTYSHYFAFMLAIGQALYVVIVFRKDARVLIGFAGGAVLAGLLYATWLPALVAQMSVKGNLGRSAETWYQHMAAAPLVYGVGTTLVWKGLNGGVRLAMGGLTLVFLVVAALLGLRAVDPRRRTFLLVWLLSPILLPLLISLTLFPFFTVRYGMIGQPPYLLLIGAGLASLPWRRAVALATPIAIAIAVSIATYFTTRVKNDFRSAVALVEPQLEADDLLLFDADFHELAWARYATSQVPRWRLLRSQHPGRVEGVLHPGEPHLDLNDVIQAHRRVWLIEADPLPEVEADLRALLAGRTEALHGHLRGIEISRFDRSR